ncbi:hypothetical protein HELRODRAFT_172954 [Helobdella robusta]|uniref:PHD-type domain-containing protein n=1 Tax=Helobdella robusta TaxID=6412 RepID=T1F672_HELRO|nr:hypothetical protein HELRODRAFT_172954 [Helobdella robusta]ESO03925.1 hypothetical protein HELRODRAFT_172954 [Helobdella robusta]
MDCTMTSATPCKEKLEFMACLNLVSTSSIKEIQTRKSERKRKSTANPQFCYFEQEPSSRHEDSCSVCQRSGELLMCDNCSLMYHLQCIHLMAVPSGHWTCPKCLSGSKRAGITTGMIADDWTGNIALIHSYVMLKTAKEEEKKKLSTLLCELVGRKKMLELEVDQIKENFLVGIIRLETNYSVVI